MNDRRLGRGDARLVQVLALTLTMVYPVVALLPLVMSWLRGEGLNWTSSLTRAGSAVPGLSDVGVVVRRDGSALWQIPHAGTIQWLAALSPALLTWALLVTGCVAVWGVVDGRTSSLRIRLLAAIPLAYGFLVPIVRLCAGLVIVSPVDRSGLAAQSLDVSELAVWFVVGLLIVVVAESFVIARRAPVEPALDPA